MTSYQQQLVHWSTSLACGDPTAVLDQLTEDCSRRDVDRFLENSMGERYRLLTEELNLVALAFDDFELRVDEYLHAVPRQTFLLNEREPQRFLRWLKAQPLTDQQLDYITCQEAEYACYELARRHRVAHLEFQEVWHRRREGFDNLGSTAGSRVIINPVYFWAHLTIAAPEVVVFLAVGAEVRSLRLTDQQCFATRKLMQHSPLCMVQWQSSCSPMTNHAHREVRELLVNGGLAAIC
jgi:hypothetical protein